jgi:hypothetical protein
MSVPCLRAAAGRKSRMVTRPTVDQQMMMRCAGGGDRGGRRVGRCEPRRPGRARPRGRRCPQRRRDQGLGVPDGQTRDRQREQQSARPSGRGGRRRRTARGYHRGPVVRPGAGQGRPPAIRSVGPPGWRSGRWPRGGPGSAFVEHSYRQYRMREGVEEAAGGFPRQFDGRRPVCRSGRSVPPVVRGTAAAAGGGRLPHRQRYPATLGQPGRPPSRRRKG